MDDFNDESLDFTGMNPLLAKQVTDLEHEVAEVAKQLDEALKMLKYARMRIRWDSIDELKRFDAKVAELELKSA